MVLNNIKDSEEPIDDTLNDIIGYALLWKMLRNNSFALPLTEDMPFKDPFEMMQHKIDAHLVKDGPIPWQQAQQESRDKIIHKFKFPNSIPNTAVEHKDAGTNGRGRTLD
jgi:hypothetical protein